jgi:hypothetical protein
VQSVEVATFSEGGFTIRPTLLTSHKLPFFDDPQLCWASYPFSALLTGPAFTAMGAVYWGRCYAFGAAFFALAVVMPVKLDWASLGFGLLWSAVLTMLGLRLKRLGLEASARPADDEGERPRKSA